MNIKAQDLQSLLAVIEGKGFSIPEVISILQTSISPKEKIIKSVDEIIFTIDYEKTIPEMFVLGCYDWKNSGVTEKNFPKLNKFSGKVKVSGRLFNFKGGITTKQAKTKMTKSGYRATSLFEILWLGFKYPNLQKLLSIAALASVWKDGSRSRSIPYLDANGRWRGLSLNWDYKNWPGNYLFFGLKNI